MEKKFSPSLISYIKHCPLRWKLDQIHAPQISVYVKEKEFGQVFHQVIKLYFQNIVDKPSPRQIRELAEKMFDVGYTVNIMKQKAKRLLENFIDFEINRSRTWQVYKPELVEQKIEVQKEQLKEDLNIDVPQNFITFIDFYGNKTWLDWKTGAIPYVDEFLQFQYGFSKLMLELSNHVVEKGFFVSLTTGILMQPPRTSRSWVIQQIKDVVDIIKEERFRPHRSYLCAYCPYDLRCSFANKCLWLVI